jgi:hypothetical protein
MQCVVRTGSRGGFCVALAALVVACGGSSIDERGDDGGGGAGGSGAGASGGTASGGNASGGTASGGTASGGTATGGTASGGTASGGTASGGTASGGTASGGTATGGTATGGTATGGTVTGGTGGSEPPECTPSDDSNGIPPDDCPELERLVLWNPRVEDSSGDGKVSPGERALVRVVLSDVSGLGHSGYPGVVFEATDPNVTFVEDSRDFNLFALLACDSYEAQIEIQVGEVLPGTVVEVVARAGSLNRECPDAPSLTVPIAID